MLLVETLSSLSADKSRENNPIGVEHASGSEKSTRPASCLIIMAAILCPLLQQFWAAKGQTVHQISGHRDIQAVVTDTVRCFV